MHTFLFTDIAESTRLWQHYPGEMSVALAAHDSILQRVIPDSNGRIVKSTGDGVLASFESVRDASNAAVELQHELKQYPWKETGALKVRMGIHSGEAESREGDFFGTTVNKAARVMSLAAGGQVLLSDLSYAMLNESDSGRMGGRLLGHYRLKGLSGRTGIYQLTHPNLVAEFPNISGGEAVPNNLPDQLTSFVGREREKNQILNYLLDTDEDLDRRRLVTLIGPGGTGKTRLSIESARDVREAFTDGVWLVELAPLTDPESIPQLILTTLNLSESPEISTVDLILNYLRDRQALVIFDNCEHLVEASAHLIDLLLKAAPLIQVLASSREALGIYGETVMRIPSLPLPKTEEKTWDQIQQSEAVQLFIKRAEAAHAERWMKDEHGEAIAQICRRLDGIPLAIEMAAARLRVFSPNQILHRLDDRFRLLTGGSRTALPRLQTLQALIDWSYDLLSEEEQGLLMDLSVFADGWTIEMAEEVCSDWDVYSLLPQLVDKSLVVAEPISDGMRYKFLETMRQYSRDRLMASGRSAQLRHRHLRYFVEFTDAEDLLELEAVEEHILKCFPNFENIRAALTWGIEKDLLSALELAGNMSNIWPLTSTREGLSWVERILDNFESEFGTPTPAGQEKRVNKALGFGFLTRAALVGSLGHNEQGSLSAKKAIEYFRAAGMEEWETVSEGIFALQGISYGESKESLGALERALAQASRRPQSYLYAAMLSIQGLAKLYIERDIPAAIAVLEQAVAIVPEIGSQSVAGSFALIKIQAFSKNWERARELADLGIELSSQEYYKENKRNLYMYRAERGHIERQSGNHDAALNIYARIILAYREMSMEPAVANLLECFAIIALQKGQLARASCLFGAAEALRERIQTDMAPYERLEYEAAVGQLRSIMDPQELESNWRSGKKFNTDQAIEFARDYAELRLE